MMADRSEFFSDPSRALYNSCLGYESKAGVPTPGWRAADDLAGCERRGANLRDMMSEMRSWHELAVRASHSVRQILAPRDRGEEGREVAQRAHGRKPKVTDHQS
jgi:hypothetical protein